MSDDDTHSAWRDFWKGTLSALVGGLIAGLSAIAGSYFTAKFQMSAQSESQRTEEQRKVYASLMGRKPTAEQLNFSRIEARVTSDFHEELWRRAGLPKESLDLQEALRWMHRSEDLVSEIPKSNQELFKDLATVQALFPDTPRLNELCAKLYNFHTIIISTSVPHDGPVERVAQWKEQGQREGQALAEREYGKPIEELVTYLRTQLPK